MRTLLLSAAAFAALASSAWAGDASWGDGVEVMNDADLAEHRGGFMVAGIDINFAAVVTTSINGVPALTTQLTWTDAGAIIQETIGGGVGISSSLTPDQLLALGLSPNAAGVVVQDSSGATQIIHNVTEGALQNILINTASDQDISQTIDVRLELPNFELLQGNFIAERFGIHITDDINTAMFFDPG